MDSRSIAIEALQSRLGAYKINETGTMQSGNVPHYVKPKNENWRRNDVYLYLDGFYGWWQVQNCLFLKAFCSVSDIYLILDFHILYIHSFEYMQCVLFCWL